MARTHVVEPYELPALAQADYWLDAMKVARAVAGLVKPVKMNYEIHGNTLPHLHLHLFPRHLHDPYVGGPTKLTVARHRSGRSRSSGEIFELKTVLMPGRIVTRWESGLPWMTRTRAPGRDKAAGHAER